MIINSKKQIRNCSPLIKLFIHKRTGNYGPTGQLGLTTLGNGTTAMCSFAMVLKIGGAIIQPKAVTYPFLVAPFNDRRLFWKLVLGHVNTISDDNEIKLFGMPEADIPVLLSMGAEVWRPRRIMCRPTDKLEFELVKTTLWKTRQKTISPKWLKHR